MKHSLSRTLFVTGLLALGLLACARVPAADPARVALDTAIQHWVTAVNVQDMATLNATMTEDVELLDTNGATASGRESAAQWLRDLAAGGKLSATTREISILGDIAWHVVALTQTRMNGDVQALGQALEIWKRVNGEWKLHRRMSGTPSVSLTRPSTNEPILDRPKD